MLNIWGRISSINVRKVVWCAQELGLNFQRTEAGGPFGVVQTPEYRALNPNAVVPTIDDGEGAQRVLLWESNVIVRYLCAKYASGTLYPIDLAERFDAECWMDWQQTTLNPAGRNAFLQWVRTAPAERQPALIDHSVRSTEALFEMLDKHLAQRPYMAGERFTMADIPIGCETHRWFGLPSADYRRPQWPHVERWYSALLSRSGTRGVLDLSID